MAAGLGFKTFTSGEVLTAADTNGYLMQGVMVFASASARTAAITAPTEGQYSYLKDTNSTEYYDGSAWVAGVEGDISGVTAGTGISGGGTSGTVTVTNSMATTITTKGDLVPGTGSGTFARLAVGNNGETLVADSSTSTGLRYQSNFAAGKNKIINGAFDNWQRGTTTTTQGYLPDRFQLSANPGTNTYSRQTFTPGTAPVSGYEAQYFARIACSATATYFDVSQYIEDVRTLAGQTVTFSFWAKASSSVGVLPLLRQNFGSGGSANVDNTGTTLTFTSSWVRYSFTTTLGSMSGKTIGTSSYLAAFFYQTSGTVGSNTIDTWGWQVEAGNTATAFQTATGTLQGELAACQRYYYLVASGATLPLGSGWCDAITQGMVLTQFPVQMRTSPSIVQTSGTNYYYINTANTSKAFNSFVGINIATQNMATYYATITGGVAGQGGYSYTNNAAASIALSLIHI